MKRKRYKLYDNYTTYYILVGIALMYALLAALNIWIYRECDVVSETSLDKGTQRKTTENELPSLTQCTA